MLQFWIPEIKFPWTALELLSCSKYQIDNSGNTLKRMIKYSATYSLLSLVLITGCQSMTGPIDRNNPTHVPPPGTLVELHRAVPVYPGYSRSFFQSGKPAKFSEINQRYPWCQFRLYEPPEALNSERSIQPDRFLVTEAYRIPELAVAAPRLLASSFLSLSIFDDDRSDLNLSSVMKITSSKQPQVVEFKCSIFADPVINDYVTINEMQQAIGDTVTLHLAE